MQCKCCISPFMFEKLLLNWCFTAKETKCVKSKGEIQWDWRVRTIWCVYVQHNNPRDSLELSGYLIPPFNLLCHGSPEGFSSSWFAILEFHKEGMQLRQHLGIGAEMGKLWLWCVNRCRHLWAALQLRSQVVGLMWYRENMSPTYRLHRNQILLLQAEGPIMPIVSNCFLKRIICAI